MSKIVDIREALLNKAMKEWPIEKKIATRAVYLFRQEHAEYFDYPFKTYSLLIMTYMLDCFTQAAIEYRDELEFIVLAELAGLSDEEAVEACNQRLKNNVTPVFARMAELDSELRKIENVAEEEDD
jgi:hypothetical protein